MTGDGDRKPRVTVAGAGAAGLCAALAAHEAGASVTVLEEGADSHEAGGNAWFSGGLWLFAYESAEDIGGLLEFDADAIDLTPFPSTAYRELIATMAAGAAAPELVDALVGDSLETMRWLHRQGVRFRFAGSQFGSVQRATKLVLPGGAILQSVGAGEGFVQALLDALERCQIPIRWGSGLREVLVESGEVAGVRAGDGAEFDADAVIIASGGFQANAQMRSEHLGEQWADVMLRGTAHARGHGHRAALAAGARTLGDWSQCHAISIDASAPQPPSHLTGTPQRFSRAFWLGILVNRDGQRFFDEGEDVWQRTYSKMGREILAQPERIGFHVFDSHHAERVRELCSGVEAVAADTLEQLAIRLGVDAEGLVRTVRDYNDACCSATEFDPTRPDGKRADVHPPKSNWALPLDRPPFLGYRAACGITFTHGGIAIDADARVLSTTGPPVSGLYAAGEVTGGIFFGNYPGGSSLMRSAVFGRRAGQLAGRGEQPSTLAR